MGWPITPGALTSFLRRIQVDYDPASIIISENGASFSDGPDESGAIDDDRRTRYLSRHIEAVAAALAVGVPVTGYFVWSLLDNFEWSSGYTQRFGIVWVDPDNQTRTPKNSFYWYRDFLAADT